MPDRDICMPHGMYGYRYACHSSSAVHASPDITTTSRPGGDLSCRFMALSSPTGYHASLRRQIDYRKQNNENGKTYSAKMPPIMLLS